MSEIMRFDLGGDEMIGGKENDMMFSRVRAGTVLAKDKRIAGLEAENERLKDDIGAAAWILEWMVAEKYRKPDVPILIEQARRNYRKHSEQLTTTLAKLTIARERLKQDAMILAGVGEAEAALLVGEALQSLDNDEEKIDVGTC